MSEVNTKLWVRSSNNFIVVINTLYILNYHALVRYYITFYQYTKNSCVAAHYRLPRETEK